MIKGHLEIELHNHKTGLKDKIEQDNLVTNSLNHFVDFVMGQDGTVTKIMPIYSRALGGLLIFEDPLVESVNNTLFPVSNFLTGYAGRSLNTSDAERGSINELDSGAVPNGYMTVWDFATSQANGLISSMSLTHADLENVNTHPILGSIVTGFNGGSNETNANRIIKYDDRYEYYIDRSTGNLVKYRLSPDRNYKITDHYQSRTVLNQIVEESAFSEFSTSNWANGFNGKYYSIVPESTKENGRLSLQIVEVDAITYQLSRRYYIYINARNSSYNHFNNGDGENDWKNIAGFGSICISNGILYVSELTDINSGGETIRVHKIFGFDLESLEPTIPGSTTVSVTTDESHSICDVVDPNISTSIQGATLFPSKDGGVIIQYYLDKRDSSNNQYCKVAAATLNGRIKIYSKEFIPDRHREQCNSYSSVNNDIVISWMSTIGTTYLGIKSNYLGTICNLETPFEKTVSTSMKVKYTLTNV